MSTRRHVRVVAWDEADQEDHVPTPFRVVDWRTHAAPLRTALIRARQHLLSLQDEDGHWVGELEGDSILESEYILLQAFLGREGSEICRKAARYLLEKQLPHGGWALYPGGKLDVSASVKAYFALKLTGHEPSSEPLQAARTAILAHGGADAVNSFTRFYLALLGQISYEQCPAVPPEVLLLPRWAPVGVHRISAWSRTILVPLSIMSSVQPTRQLEPRHCIRELFLRAPEEWPAPRCPGLPQKRGPFTWERFFGGVDRLWKMLQRRGWLPLRQRAIAAAERWMLERFDESDGLGAIFPPMVWSIVALRCLGYEDDSSEVQYCQERLDGLILEEEESARLQPCKSPVWDTAISLRALADAGMPPDHPDIERAARWLLAREIRRPGDWAAKVRAEPTGWCFEYANQFYPDVDDTVMALMALRRQFDTAQLTGSWSPDLRLAGGDDQDEGLEAARTARRSALLDRITSATARGERWIVAMQNRDGGWGAFDRDNNAAFLCRVPFADHNAMIDPSTPDLTGRVLEALGKLGRRVGDPAVDRAIAYLRGQQEPDGCWFGRWGVNYIYGTWQVLCGLAAVGVPCDDPATIAGANWLTAQQQPCGGWGESADSYAEPHRRGQGPVTASQTAWAIMGLLAAGRHQHAAVARGVQYLLQTQQTDGTWNEKEFTGTGFPRVFYLRYHMYPLYFPLMALSRWAATLHVTWTAPADAKSELCEQALALSD